MTTFEKKIEPILDLMAEKLKKYENIKADSDLLCLNGQYCSFTLMICFNV